MSCNKIFKSVILYTIILALAVFPRPSHAITLQEEDELAREFLKVVRKQFQMIQDPVILSYVDAVGKRIMAQVPNAPFQGRFYVFKSNVYNAFAAPAGHIFISSGIMSAMDSEDELAGILAHEISHVVCRHISDKIERASKVNLVALAGMVAGIFLGAAGAGAAANAVSVGSMAAGQSAMLAYSRQDERQADNIGLQYLNDAGYSARGLLAILKKIRAKTWFGPEEIPTYLSTHPATEERISRIHAWIEDHEPAESKPMAVPYDFGMVHARLNALYGDTADALKQFSARVAQDPSDPVAHYGYALALSGANRWEESIAHLKKALKQRAFDPAILSDLGRVYYLSGRYEEARSVLEGAVSIDPNLDYALLYLGRTRLEMQNYAGAVEALQKLLESAPDHPTVRYFLGEAYGRMGRMEKAHYQLGLYYKRKGEFKTAAFHLSRVLKATADEDKKDEIKKRLAEIDEEEAEARREAEAAEPRRKKLR